MQSNMMSDEELFNNIMQQNEKKEIFSLIMSTLKSQSEKCKGPVLYSVFLLV